jgi:hypothetical protein
MQGKDVSILMVHENLRETVHTFGKDANHDGYCKNVEAPLQSIAS